MSELDVVEALHEAKSRSEGEIDTMPAVQNYKLQVQIFQFKMFDIGTDEFKQSRRWATREFIERVGGLMTGKAAALDDAVLRI